MTKDERITVIGVMAELETVQDNLREQEAAIEKIIQKLMLEGSRKI